jgi:hypothetical protein
MNENFAIIVHGWLENVNTTWVNKTISSLLQNRGGCVFFMDYSKYSTVWNYFDLVTHFDGLSELLLKKFKQIGSYDRQFCYGFSFGARLCVNAGIDIGQQKIGRMDLCELTGPGFGPIWFFWPNPRARDPKLASKNTQCINTSIDKGTAVYNCHQNFRMGNCGSSQPAAGPYPLGSHGLCPYFYNSAFDHEFIADNQFKCTSANQANITSNPKVRMGYLGENDRNSVRGEIFIATAKYAPYKVVNNVVDNKP